MGMGGKPIPLLVTPSLARSCIASNVFGGKFVATALVYAFSCKFIDWDGDNPVTSFILLSGLANPEILTLLEPADDSIALRLPIFLPSKCPDSSKLAWG